MLVQDLVEDSDVVSGVVSAYGLQNTADSFKMLGKHHSGTLVFETRLNIS